MTSSATHPAEKLNGKIAPEHAEQIVWLADYAGEKNLSRAEIGKLLGRDGSTVSRIFNGTYSADHKQIAETISNFRATLASRQSFGDEPIVDLKITREICKFLEFVRQSQSIGLIWGPNQSGKSVAVKKYCRENPGVSTFVKVPVGGATKMFLESLMKSIHRSPRKCYIEMRDIAHAYFTSDRLLAVDEFHQTMVGRRLKMVTIELLREMHDQDDLHDQRRVPMVYVGTHIMKDMFESEKFQMFLGQTANRAPLMLHVPAKPYEQDVDAICVAYGLPRPEGDIRDSVFEIANASGIGKLSKFLRLSRQLANKKSIPFAWKHFIDTISMLANWKDGTGKGEQQ